MSLGWESAGIWLRARLRLRSRWPILAALLALLVVAAVLLLSWRSEDRSLARIRDLGILRVGIDPSFPPFESLDANGQIVGLDADLAQALAARWGVKVQFESIGFDGLLDAIWAGRVDAVISALPLEPRFTRDVAYSQPYFEAGLHLVVPDGSPIAGASDLNSRRLAVEWGSDADAQGRELRKRVPNLTVGAYPTPDAALQAVIAGEADAALVDGVTARQFVAHTAGIQIVQPPLVSAPYVVALPIKARTLLDEVNRALDEMRADGTLERLQNKWFTP